MGPSALAQTICQHTLHQLHASRLSGTSPDGWEVGQNRRHPSRSSSSCMSGVRTSRSTANIALSAKANINPDTSDLKAYVGFSVKLAQRDCKLHAVCLFSDPSAMFSHSHGILSWDVQHWRRISMSTRYRKGSMIHLFVDSQMSIFVSRHPISFDIFSQSDFESNPSLLPSYVDLRFEIGIVLPRTTHSLSTIPPSTFPSVRSY